MNTVNREYGEFVDHLEDREFFGQKLGLERIQRCLGKFGNPQKTLKIIHVAGTNGKGSTIAFASEMLKRAGYRVGTFTSPHLTDFCERIRINHRNIPRKDVVRFLREIRKVEKNDPLTFFELVAVMGLLYFEEQKPDYVFLETGLGGRLDATNVVIPILSVITTIGFDHMLFLGNTLEEIASEKAGIIKKKIPVMTGTMDEKALAVICTQASRMKSEWIQALSFLELFSDLEPGLQGQYQRDNANLALMIVEFLQQKHGVKVRNSDIQTGIRDTSWPGRLQVLSETPLVVFDVAHNVMGIEALTKSLSGLYPGILFHVLFGCMKDKDSEMMLSVLTQWTEGLFCLTQTAMKRTTPVSDLAQVLKDLGREALLLPDSGVAYDVMKTRVHEGEGLLVCGSLFLIAELMQK